MHNQTTQQFPIVSDVLTNSSGQTRKTDFKSAQLNTCSLSYRLLEDCGFSIHALPFKRTLIGRHLETDGRP